MHVIIRLQHTVALISILINSFRGTRTTEGQYDKQSCQSLTTSGKRRMYKSQINPNYQQLLLFIFRFHYSVGS